ncbi:unnamed protein product, partial [Hapterophycus canaliculatus]
PSSGRCCISGCPIVPGPGSASPFGARFLYPISRKPRLLRTLSGWLAKMDPGGPAAPIDKGERMNPSFRLCFPCVCAGSLSTDPEVALEAAADPLMVKGSVRNKTAFEVIKLIQVAKECASKVSVPTFLLHGADDDIAYPSGSEEMKTLMTASSSVDILV